MLSTARLGRKHVCLLVAGLVILMDINIARKGSKFVDLSVLWAEDDQQPIHRRAPQVPLCPECLEIIQRANLTDTSFVDVATNNSHLGAVNERGEAGYVHDVTTLRRHPPKWNMTARDIAAQCENQDDWYRMLKQRVFVDWEYEQRMQGKKRSKVLSILYTSTKSHAKIVNIRETWGPKCDGLLVASDTVDETIDSVKLLHKGPEEYKNMWQKIRSMWEYVYDNYYNEYDFFHMGGDDMYLIVENLRRYLESDEIQAAQNGGTFVSSRPEKMQYPLFLGNRVKHNGDVKQIYNGGGCGYTLNKAALKLLVVDGLPHSHVDVVGSAEDLFVAEIFRKFGVFPYETKDENRGERYMAHNPGFLYNFRKNNWVGRLTMDPVEGHNHTSPQAIGFHYVSGEMMRRMHVLLYHQCPPTLMTT